MRHPSIICAILLAAILLVGALALKARAQDQASKSSVCLSLEGTWSGTLGGGANKLHIVLTFSKSGDAYSGNLNSVDQHAILAMSNIRLDGTKVHFEIAQVGGVYDGEMQSGGDSIRGTWVQTGVPPQPLNFQRGATAEKSPAAIPPGPDKMPPPPQIDVSVPTAPTAFQADGKWHLAYELHIANLEDWICKLTRVEILSSPSGASGAPGSNGGKSLAAYDANQLDAMISQPDAGEVAEPSKLAPKGSAIVFLWLTFDRRDEVPSALTHRISLRIGTYPEETTSEALPTPANREPLIVISPPLTGENWIAANGPSNTSVHRRAVIGDQKRSYISQRFAIDWLQLNPDGKSYQGDPKDNKNYRAYGAEIHAVADGVVTEVKDGIPQNIPGPSSRAVPITMETIGGNHVIMQIADGIFAFYAHMQPGSIRVKLGEKVHRGQVLGLLGNSGNSTEPHLHFDLCNANSMLFCQGLPYAFTSFEVQGRGWGWKSSESKAAPEKHTMEIPLEWEVVRFTP
ncbi:MAG TPA: M23 family metallopeptidase [Candidatus Acidoferrales bacterium]|nr:M23 family metallopeptidase [Candidatus Acidoferrales bacterium]